VSSVDFRTGIVAFPRLASVRAALSARLPSPSSLVNDY